MTEQTGAENTENTAFEAPYTEEDSDDALAGPKISPALISGGAHKALNDKMREWSGWNDAHLEFRDPGDTALSPYAVTHVPDRTFTVNLDPLVLNPNRIINTITPFRLRQEAVLTGVLLHEAGHARHSKWLPTSKEDTGSFKHSDGSVPSKATVDLAILMEESRVEGLMARDETLIGSYGLSWTMRASAAHLLPPTDLSQDPNQAMMDLIKSWALRAGRQIAYSERANSATKQWVGDFTQLLAEAIQDHLQRQDPPPARPTTIRSEIINNLASMVTCDDDTGSTMVDTSRHVLDLLFKNMPEEDRPSPDASCTNQGNSGDSAGSEDNPEDKSAKSDGAGLSEEITEGLTRSEEKANSDASSEAAQQQGSAPPKDENAGTDKVDNGGAGSESGQRYAEWRQPTRAERYVQRDAENFLRSLIDPSEGSKVTLSDQPSATVDGAALAAWKAGGMIRAPHFFVQTRREVQPQPPVKIAILVDISSSMNVLQKPSALLSWALSAAAFDLRNFAGRGQQIESCLIHWGTEASVVQETGTLIPGIREVDCNEGTTAMGKALDLVEEQIPDFFTGTSTNRLLVQFTDWELWGGGVQAAQDRVSKALNSGVNMLSVMPLVSAGYPSSLSSFIKAAAFATGKASTVLYNPADPGAVWDEAEKMLR